MKLLGILGLAALATCRPPASPPTPNILNFETHPYEVRTLSYEGQTFRVRAYEDIIYVSNPVDTIHQRMNIYIPIAYFEGGSIDRFTAESAPIFFPNQVGGYMPARPGRLQEKADKASPMGARTDAMLMALSKGYVVASPGARGRTSVQGKAPAVIVDLKAAVRYLRHNDASMPGNAERIISNGTSAGGAVSALLGATGDSPDYAPYLRALGAAEASDAIFAASAYCPITNLENADMAYEWQFRNVADYKKIDISMLDYKVERKEVAGRLSEGKQRVSADLAALFPDYLNGLNLSLPNGEKLSLSPQGDGNFKNLVKQYVLASARKAQSEGMDMGRYTFLRMEGNDIADLDFETYVTYMGRQKTPPAFDALDLSSGENQLFGDSLSDAKHFTTYSLRHSASQGQQADPAIVQLMNPLHFIGRQGVNTARHWRIRHGSKDKDTGLAISVILATALNNCGYKVDFALPWDKPHSGDYDLNELFEWMQQAVEQ